MVHERYHVEEKKNTLLYMEKLRTNYYCMIEISQIDRSSGVQRWYGSVARFIQTKHVNAV